MPGSIVNRAWRDLVRRARLVRDDIGPLLQATAAATVAWLIARRLVDHHDPFFAPISALVSLNTSLGERGLNALRLLQGVGVGIGVGELTLFLLGGGYGSIALGTFVALVVARALGSARIVLAQSAVSSILTITSANGEVGPQRLFDALIGAGVALVFSQVIFQPQPLRLLRRVEADVLTAIADALELTARTLDGNEDLALHAIDSQRELRDHLLELARMRHASARVARHSIVWRGQIKPIVRENEDVGHLDLLGGSCLMLTRTAIGAGEEDRRLLAPRISAFSKTITELASDPGDRTTRQRAVDSALDILREMRAIRSESDPEMTATLTAARIAVLDLMLFAGVDPQEALDATRGKVREKNELEVPTRPSPIKPPSPSLRSFRRLVPRIGERLRQWTRR